MIPIALTAPVIALVSAEAVTVTVLRWVPVGIAKVYVAWPAEVVVATKVVLVPPTFADIEHAALLVTIMVATTFSVVAAVVTTLGKPSQTHSPEVLLPVA
jgi:hypothetical protein